MRRAILQVALITLTAGTLAAGGASAQGSMTSTPTTPGAPNLPGMASPTTTTSPSSPGSGLPNGVPQAPVGHRQPTATDVPALKPPASSAQDQTTTPATPPIVPAPARGRSAQTGFGPGGVPVLQVVSSCEAAGRGAVVLGRNKEACLADESAAQDTLRQNWTKYAANDKTQCVGMTRTGGPASYVELLSCLEIMRDARNIQNADPLESDVTAANTTPTSRRRRH